MTSPWCYGRERGGGPRQRQAHSILRLPPLRTDERIRVTWALGQSVVTVVGWGPSSSSVPAGPWPGSLSLVLAGR